MGMRFRSIISERLGHRGYSGEAILLLPGTTSAPAITVHPDEDKGTGWASNISTITEQ